MRFALTLALAFLPLPALAQSFNIALGPTGSAPSSSYAAAGLPGVWNDVGLTAYGVHVPLVGLDGLPTAVDLRQIGATSVLQSNDPSTTGDDEALLDSMVLSFSSPLDACYWIDNLENQTYFVTLYALTPNAPTLFSSVRVDDATPGATPVGGAWSGAHVEGVSYKTFLVDVFDGEIGLHSGIPSSNTQSGLNGIQIRPATAVDVGGPHLPRAGATVRLAAYPNPASGAQTIEVQGGAASGSALEIVDVLGRIVWRENLTAAESGRTLLTWTGLRADRSPALPGVYFARLATGSGAPAAASLKLVRSR